MSEEWQRGAWRRDGGLERIEHMCGARSAEMQLSFPKSTLGLGTRGHLQSIRLGLLVAWQQHTLDMLTRSGKIPQHGATSVLCQAEALRRRPGCCMLSLPEAPMGSKVESRCTARTTIVSVARIRTSSHNDEQSPAQESGGEVGVEVTMCVVRGAKCPSSFQVTTELRMWPESSCTGSLQTQR